MSFLFAFLLCGPAQADILRVTIAGASGTPSCGGSWATPCDLQYALQTLAISGDEIWVAAGTYKPTTGTDRAATFQLKLGVGLYGGFAGTETDRSQRDLNRDDRAVTAAQGHWDPLPHEQSPRLAREPRSPSP